MGSSRFKMCAIGCAFLALTLFFTGCSDVKFKEADPLSQRAKSGEFYAEDFTQGILGKKLDVLFVVDNSNSMAEEQAKLGEKIDSFLSTLEGVDWQVGITTTDVSSGPFGIQGSLLPISGTTGHILNSTTPDYQSKFLKTIVRPESIDCIPDCASGFEQPLRASLMAMQKRDTDNRGFFREGADLGLLVLSDEDEMSTGTSNTATTGQEVLNYFTAIWGNQKRLFTYGMVVLPGDDVCKGDVGNYGDFVVEFAALTGGLVGSICEEDYAPTLGELAEHAKSLLDYVGLRYIPVEKSIEISFRPQHQSTWKLEGKRIYFDKPPKKGTRISVGYIIE